jgi:hypothetical protein
MFRLDFSIMVSLLSGSESFMRSLMEKVLTADPRILNFRLLC